MRSRPLVVLGLVAVLLALAAPVASAAGRSSFVVVLRDSVARPAEVAKEHSARFDADVTHVYRHALKGYSAVMDGRELGALRADRRVAFVARDGVARISDIQTGATWGLDRVDQRNRPLSGTYVYSATGAGVTAYVIDTGIRTTHSEFGGRAVDGFDAVDGSLPAADCNGHGTHVAGTIGGRTYGVAKGVTLVAVRVLGCDGSGSWSGVIAGIDWVAGQHAANAKAVANMSLGGSANAAVDAAVRGAIADGVTFAIAAGNSNQDACRFSPARVTEALTVGATTSSDARASYSNFGTCLDLFAPGSSITSAWSTGDSATSTISGTSMATPHVAGAAALVLQGGYAAPSVVAGTLTSRATTGVISGLNKGNIAGTPNRLLFTNP